MKISYAITVCNELKEIQQLVGFLLTHKQNEDEIVILMDSNGTEEVWSYLLKIESELGVLNTIPFNKDFSKFKNHLNLLCSEDYIFNIDADELPSETLINNVHELIEMNPEVKAFALPRVNTVEGLTQEHIQQWGWNVNQNGWVNFPDYQWRIWQNKPEIKWKNKVHEVLEGYKIMSTLPSEEEYCLHHPKTIEKQEKQNNYYNTI